MARSKAEINISKKFLTSTGMHTYRVRGGTDATCVYCRIIIAGYLQLKYNLDYTVDIDVDDLQSKMLITKTKRDFAATIVTDSDSKLVASFIDYANEAYSSPVYPRRIRKDQYQVNFDSSVLKNPENMPLQNGELWLRLKFEVGKKFARAVHPFTSESKMINEDDGTLCEFRDESSNRHRSEREVISESLQKYAGSKREKKKFGDFTIYTESDRKPFHVQKAILGARSKYFYEFIKRKIESQEDESIKLVQTTGEAVALLLRFLYCGKIEAGVDAMLDVLPLSVKMRITSLEMLCTRFLLNNIDLSNVLHIKKAGTELGVEALVTAADLFLDSVSSYVECPPS